MIEILKICPKFIKLTGLKIVYMQELFSTFVSNTMHGRQWLLNQYFEKIF